MKNDECDCLSCQVERLKNDLEELWLIGITPIAKPILKVLYKLFDRRR